MIHWQPLSMSELVTLVVGLAAVLGAVWVGLRQVGIAKRQAETQAEQLKADLFERRLATYEAAADFLHHFGESLETAEGKQRMDRFATKMRESQFLFRNSVYRKLFEIHEAANKQRYHHAMMRANHRDGLPLDPDLAQKVREGLEWSQREAEALHEVFRPDLELGAETLKIGGPEWEGVKALADRLDPPA